MQGVNVAVGELARAAIEHCGELGDNDLLTQLAALESSVQMLKGARLHLLRQARARDIPWSKISRHTGVAPTTWRNRLDSEVTG